MVTKAYVTYILVDFGGILNKKLQIGNIYNFKVFYILLNLI